MNNNDIKYLVSTTPYRTYMMCSLDTKTLITFENPVDLLDPKGYIKSEYTTIQIRRI